MKHKIPAFILLAVLLIAGGFFIAGERNHVPAAPGVELLKNTGFEQVTREELPEHWLPDAYIASSRVTAFSMGEGRTGRAVRIENDSPNDARFLQSVQVVPDTLYRFSGYVMADAAGGLGANLSVQGIYVFSDPVYQTNGVWQQIALYGKTGKNQREVTLFIRLGGYSGESGGYAMFDDLSLMAVPEAPPEALVTSWDVPDESVPYEDESSSPAAPAAPWLVVIMAIGALIMLKLARDAETAVTLGNEQTRPLPSWALPAVLLAAFISRVLVAWRVPGFPVDIGCFTAWADAMAAKGPGSFYVSGFFSDYPPGYMLVLWPLGILGRWMGTGATEMLVKLPAIVGDLLIILLLFRVAAGRVNERAALKLSMLYAFNPLPYLAGAAWGQVDSVPALLLIITVLLVIKQRWRYALPVYVLAVLMKPQALMAGPLGLFALVMDLIWRRDTKTWKDFGLGALLSILLAAMAVVPFFNEQNGVPWIIGLYGNTMGFYRYASVNAANLYFLFGKNWVGIDNEAPMLLRLAGFLTLLAPAAIYALRNPPLLKLKKEWMILLAALLPAAFVLIPQPIATTGTLLMVSVSLVVFFQYGRGKSAALLPLLAGVMLTGYSVLGTMMHERYLFLAAAMFALSYILRRDRRVLVLLIAVSALCFLNSGLALDRGVRIGGGAGNLSAPEAGLISDSAWLEYALSALSLFVAGFALYVGLVLTSPDAKTLRIKSRLPDREIQSPLARCARLLAPTTRVRFDRKDALVMLGVTALYAVLALVNLGSLKAPQTPWVSTGDIQEAVLDLKEIRDFRLYYYGGIHWRDSDFTVQTSEDGETWTAYPAKMQYGDLFAWRALNQSYTSPDGSVAHYSIPQELEARYVKIISSGPQLTLMEIIAQDSETGENLPLSPLGADAAPLADEQDTLKGPPSWFNSMYFDEIYHARTAYEQRNALLNLEPSAIYETSHPPLGKLLMTFSVMLFGMTPFGWRFAGAMAGVLMLPGLYLLGKQLTGKRRWGLFAMLLMAFDFMHFTQTRIATIDSFATLFIIYAYFFMLRYMMRDHFGTPLSKSLLPLFLSGLMMGLAIAAKWTGIYAGLGLAVLFFWTLARNINKGLACANLTEDETDALGDCAGIAKNARMRYLRDTWMTLLWCVLFFLAVPAVIYYLSYIPVFIQTPGGLTVQKVINANVGMYNYHSSPGLGADHPWSSPWYEWPLIIKPMYYYSGGVARGTASTILAFGNPAVWLSGLAALLITAFIAAKQRLARQHTLAEERRATLPVDRDDPRPLILLIAFAAQYLPWVLVPRGTYIYHYFPSVPFIILCVTLLLFYLSGRYRKAALGLGAGLVILSFLLFAAFFPYISGVRVSTSWLDAMKWLPNWLYY